MVLYLASNSPRRRQLLSLVGWDFQVAPVEVDETPFPAEDPQAYVVRLAEKKALAAAEVLAQSSQPQGLVLASDTTVVANGQILGKPSGADEAVRVLRQLRGKVHEVHTGLAALRQSDGLLLTDLCITQVPMRSYAEEEIQEYVASGDPLDKAGSYAIQHAGFHPVKNLKGCFASVMGLPLCHLTRLVRKMGLEPRNHVPKPARTAWCMSVQFQGQCCGEIPSVNISILLIHIAMNLPVLNRFSMLSLVSLLLLLSGCGLLRPDPTPYRPAAGPVQFSAAGARNPALLQQTVNNFLADWKKRDYPAMYDLVTGVTRDAISLEEFTRRYQDAENKMTATSLDCEVLGALTTETSAQINLRVSYHTTILGDLQSQAVLKLTLENDAWRIQWDDGLIHERLKGGNRFVLEVNPPSRGNIYDRGGHALAAFANAVALGVVPGKIDYNNEQTLLAELSNLTGKSPDAIRALYEHADPTWYIPVGEVSAEAVQTDLEILKSLEPGLQMNTFRARYYEDGGAAAHAVGYVQPIPAEKAAEYAAKGYLPDEMVGATGLEQWGETYLRGRPKAALYVVDPPGETITRLAEVQAEPAQSVYTTLDKELQLKIQRSMGLYRGAVVVMERDSGKILAIASNPTFDSNVFEPANRNSTLLDQIYTNPDNPLYNRATQGQYPLGSVFKIITMAAGLESGLFKPDSEYVCGHVFNELDYPLYDWTYTYGVAPSGLLDLSGGLIRSCNPWFWHIGLALYRDPQHQLDVTRMARGFGLGSITGLDQVAEAPGSIPDPANEDRAVQDAIGQGDLLVTPLQVADFIAAVGNGGTLYRPQLVEKVAKLDGSLTYSFKPEVRGKLPVSAEHLKIIQDAMVGVIQSTKPMGTAHFVLANLDIPLAGKTGTAQTAADPNAWFGGYTFANQSGKPDIAIVVIMENAGEGSEIAAPLFRRVVQLYFSNNQNPGAMLPWESTFYMVATPQADATSTPKPQPLGTPVPAGTIPPSATPTAVR